MSAVIDAHQHFWRFGTHQTSWMEVPPYAGDPAFGQIRRSFGPDDLLPELRAAGIHGVVTVEAADGEAENRALLDAAREHPWIIGVVGWVPLERPDDAAMLLSELSKDCRFVGVRHLINVEPDPDWIVRTEVLDGLRVIAAHGLVFDFVGISPHHLAHVPRLAERVADLRIVIDHLGKPPIVAGPFEPWASLLRQAAEAPNVFAKISGLDAGGPGRWSAADLRPWVEHALEVFGPARLMFGSDWPVSILRGGYQTVWRETCAVLAPLAVADRNRTLGGTAVEIYRLDAGRLSGAGADG